MSLPIYQRVAVTDAGDVIPGAEYTVINENTGVAAPIYSDRTGSTLLTAPYFANSVGVIQFYIAQGTTFRVAASGGVGTYTDRYVYGVAEAVLVNPNGNVGINISTPQNTLSIKGTTNELDIETFATGVTLESLDRANDTKQSDMSFYARYGNHTFYTGAYTEVMRIDNTGIVSIPNGISFGDAGGSAGTTNTSNTLDSYEEGTWTPTSDSGTLTVSGATYTKIGRQVTIMAEAISFADLTSSVSLKIGGLPFLQSVTGSGVAMWSRVSVPCGTAYISGQKIFFYSDSSSGNFNPLLHANLLSGNGVYFVATYFTL
jgi:hypothetical protein